jgi:hypothetical protein
MELRIRRKYLYKVVLILMQLAFQRTVEPKVKIVVVLGENRTAPIKVSDTASLITRSCSNHESLHSLFTNKVLFAK